MFRGLLLVGIVNSFIGEASTINKSGREPIDGSGGYG